MTTRPEKGYYTVAELIEYLESFPSNAKVMISTYAAGNDHLYPYEILRIRKDRDFNQIIIEAEDN